jgi:DNA-repair protein XRCC3
MHGQRAQQLLRLAAKLKELAHKFDIATVVLNQVVDKPSDGQNRRTAAPWELGACGTPDGSMRVPALGLAWSSCVNTRLVLTRRAASALMPESAAVAPYDSMWRRHLHVAFSPRLPMGAEAPFWVREEGVVGAVAA